MAKSSPTVDPCVEPRGVDDLQTRFGAVRGRSRRLVEPLAPEDCVVQSMPDVSPTKWHLAHVTWFFETFVLKPHAPEYRPFHPDFEYLFNSYYNLVGEQYPRPRRGLVTRPTVAETLDYRGHVDDAMRRLLQAGPSDEVRELVELGLQHEQQHQELLLMDIKHVLSCNPLFPAYRDDLDGASGPATAPSDDPGRWPMFDGGVVEIGHAGAGFSFDNERPRHEVLVRPFRLAPRLTTNGEYLGFLQDGGYRRPELWLADGWTALGERRWRAPLYWVERDGTWHEFTLGGLRPLALDAPVCHVSYYEADAYARWHGERLVEEAEWERVARSVPVEGNFVEQDRLHPCPAAHDDDAAPRQLYGDAWEWTRSAYLPYPGFREAPGAVGEYNGKFMCNQMVLRGGACVTPHDHVRPSYRNFFYPHQRWQFAGIRLAADVEG
jgi:ergothioneine biosynthesis protein EgtB